MANCGHVAPLIVRAGTDVEHVRFPTTHGLGGRASAKPAERSSSLAPGDSLILVSDGVINTGKGKAGIGVDGLVEAALRSERGTGADTVREIHRTVLAAARGELSDDATAVCLSVE